MLYDWRPTPLATSPRWQTRQISLGFTVADVCYYWQAVASALQYHSFPPLFDVFLESKRFRYDSGSLHELLGDEAGRVAAPIVLAVSNRFSSMAHFAISIGTPILLTTARQNNHDIIRITFDIGFLSTSHASWLLWHIEQAIPTTKGSRPISRPSVVIQKVEDLLFCNDGMPSTCRYERPDSHIFPPIGQRVHTCFYERVKAFPLAPAIFVFDLREPSGTEPIITINYLELFLCALRFVRRLELGGIRPGDSVVLGHLQPHLAVIATVALSISRIASIPAEALNGIPHHSYHPTPSAIISENYFPGTTLPIIDPPQCSTENLYTEDTWWLHLPEVIEDQPFLFYMPSGTFLSNAKFLGSLLENYDSLSLCRKRIFYSDCKVNCRTLEIIWQTLLHGGSICGILGDLSGKSVVSLAQTFPQTHLFLDEETLRRDIANFYTATEGVNQPTIILPQEPTSSTKALLNSIRLSCVAMQKSASCSSTVKDPIRIILSCISDSNLTPETVLRALETGVNLNKVNTGTSVKLISGNKVVKYGGSVRAAEAYNMEYVRKRTRINIPIVHLAFFHEGCTYIVMDYVHGRTLQDIWPSSNEIQRHMWASQLATVIELLRAVPSTHYTRPGPLNPRTELKCEGPWFTTFGAGPFHSHRDLATWLNRKLSIARRGGEKETSAYPMFQSTGRLVFTHQDLAARNVIVDDDHRLWVIDWELAGWYPEYFEYAGIASDTGPVPRGWKEMILSYLQLYKREHEILQSLSWVLAVMPFS